MKRRGVNCTFHYLPLNESEFYKKFYPNDSKTNLPVSKLISETIVRFPIWVGMEKLQKNIIVNAIEVIYSLVC